MDPLTFETTVSTGTADGSYRFEQGVANVADPWSLPCARALAARLSAYGFTPVTPDTADAVGTTGGWAELTRLHTCEGGESVMRYALTGCLAFLNEDRNVALYVQLVSGKVERRLTADAALAGALAIPTGLRWVGSVVRGGAGRMGRIAAIERGMASRYRHLLPDTAWVQVPYYDRKHTILLSETKIKGAWQARAEGPKPRGRRARLQVRGRNGGWRSRGAVQVTVGPNGTVGVGTHWFRPEPEGDHVNLTAHGGVEPTYRMTREDYDALVEGIRNVSEAVQ